MGASSVLVEKRTKSLEKSLSRATAPKAAPAKAAPAKAAPAKAKPTNTPPRRAKALEKAGTAPSEGGHCHHSQNLSS